MESAFGLSLSGPLEGGDRSPSASPGYAWAEMVQELLPEHIRRNREQWDRWAADYVAEGERSWASEPTWGIWWVPEADLNVLPDVRGLDSIELGCGTAYVSAWLTRRGARCTGIDNSQEQLKTARRLQDEHGLHFTLMHGSAERVPLPDASFDFAISEYGASIWCDPYVWIPEAARLLRPGGRLVFPVNSAFFMAFAPDDDVAVTTTLVRPYFGMHRFEWPSEEDNSVEFHLPHGEMVRLLRSCWFEIENLVEIQAPPDATTRYPGVPAEWAQKWPSEEVWVVRKKE